MEVNVLLEKHAKGEFDAYFKYPTSVTNAIVITDNLIHSAGGPCHACVDRGMLRNGKTEYVITYSDPSLVDNPGAVQYYDWLINQSFFSDVFLCKDVLLSLKHGFVKATNVEAAKWLGAAQLSRIPTSEFRGSMKAAYDILASGFEIHPILLTYICTELKTETDKKKVFSTRKTNWDSFSNYNNYYCLNSSHLPFVYFNTVEGITQMCKDDPQKDNKLKRSHLFSESKWPSQSNRVLSENSNPLEEEVRETFRSLFSKVPSMLFNTKIPEEGEEYKSLWEGAIEKLLYNSPFMQQNEKQGKLALNLSDLEAFSKKHKLGA